MPHSVKEYAQIIAYYETLVREWELWGETVEKTVIGEQAQEDKKHWPEKGAGLTLASFFMSKKHAASSIYKSISTQDIQYL